MPCHFSKKTAGSKSTYIWPVKADQLRSRTKKKGPAYPAPNVERDPGWGQIYSEKDPPCVPCEKAMYGFKLAGSDFGFSFDAKVEPNGWKKI